MEELLEDLYENRVLNSESTCKWLKECYYPLCNEIKEIVNDEDKYGKIEDLIEKILAESTDYYGIEGMKLGISFVNEVQSFKFQKGGAVV